MALFVRLAPNPETLREIMLAHADFRLSHAQLFAARVIFRTTLLLPYIYESRLPTNRLDGLRMGFRNNGADVHLVECYIDGRLHGLRRIWRDNGRIARIETYKRGALYGPCNTWYDNGKPKQQTHYIWDSLEHGPVTTWFKSGQIAEQYDMVFDNVHGTYTSWYDNGQLHARCEYWSGAYHGQQLSWYDNGQQKKQQTFVNNKRVGDCMRWARDGALIKHIVYTRTVIVSNDPDDNADPAVARRDLACAVTWRYWIARYVVWPIVWHILVK